MPRHRLSIALWLLSTSIMLIAVFGCSDDDNGTGPDNLTLDPLVISIATVDSVSHRSNQNIAVTVNETAGLPYELGGFDFLIQYDSMVLDFQSIQPGRLLIDWGWEYFTFRPGGLGDCGGVPCPGNLLRVVALAETNNGPYHPSAFSGSAGVLFSMVFLATNDTVYDCSWAPIRFVWYDCADNNISSQSGDSTYLSNRVYDFDDTLNIATDGAYPTVYGAPATCGTAVPERTPRNVTFRHGGIGLGCPAEVDTRGDINGNGVSFEVADFVGFTNVLLEGYGSLTDSAASTVASDINADGNVWTLADLVYLKRIIVGDALPYPSKPVDTADVNLTLSGNFSVDVGMGSKIGAALVYIQGNVTPTLEASNMDMTYHYDGANTRILIYSLQIESFSGAFLSVSGDIVSIEMATIDGNAVNVLGP